MERFREELRIERRERKEIEEEWREAKKDIMRVLKVVEEEQGKSRKRKIG